MNFHQSNSLYTKFQKADLAIADLTITYEREQAVDFTMPFMNLGELNSNETLQGLYVRTQHNITCARMLNFKPTFSTKITQTNMNFLNWP